MSPIVSCPSGKLRYGEEGDAKEGLRNAVSKSPSNPRRREKRYYLCDQCGGWHLTSTNGRSAPLHRPIEEIIKDDIES